DGPEDGDLSFVEKDINMIVDPMSLQYMEGSEVDFVQDNLLGGGFKVNNPNAVKSCGCGNSFQTEGGGGGCGGCSGCGS
ncbi:HesB/IscA family protein, partial [Streptomyces niveiscabiei]|uniref:HesB/IscA family protein n=1 Tax=Streptomyces niveiscabiei TaxID=164115 RepID=UPI0038F61144